MDNANLIIDKIWLGNAAAALDPDFLQENNIKTVFNCTKNYPFHSSVRRQYRVPVDDSLQDEDIRNLELWSFEIVTKMMNEYKMGNTMLVHCAAGIQRSASSVAMFLMTLYKMSPEDAIQFIKERRPIAFRPAVNFDRSIRGFYSSLEKMRGGQT